MKEPADTGNVRRLARCALLAMFWMLGLASARAGGNVVPSPTMEISRKDRWFVAELSINNPKIDFQGKTLRITEAWVEKAHRIDYIMGVIPKRVELPWYWVCLRTKGELSFEAAIVCTDDNYGGPTYGRPTNSGMSVSFTGDPDEVISFFYTNQKLYGRYVFSVVKSVLHQSGKPRKPDIVLRPK